MSTNVETRVYAMVSCLSRLTKHRSFPYFWSFLVFSSSRFLSASSFFLRSLRCLYLNAFNARFCRFFSFEAWFSSLGRWCCLSMQCLHLRFRCLFHCLLPKAERPVACQTEQRFIPREVSQSYLQSIAFFRNLQHKDYWL